MANIPEEALLALAVKNKGGGGGTGNYNDLSNQPQIAGVTLIGNKTASDLGLATQTDLAQKASIQDLAGKQDALTAGKYISIDANNEISVERVVPNEAFSYTFTVVDNNSVEIIKTVAGVVVFDEVYSCWDPVAQQQTDVNETLDDAINIHVYMSGERSYTLLIASDTHEAGFKQSTPWYERNTFTETFSTVDHSGEKLVIKSELDAELNTIKDGTNIDSFGDVETALAGKQSVLTAGKYISIDANNEITVNREIPNVSASYELKTTSTSDPEINTDVIKRVNGEIVWQENYNYQTVRDNPVTIDDVFVLSYSGQWKYKLLVASDDHAAGYEQTWGWSAWVDYTENFSLVDNTGKKLIIKEELDTALANKQDKTDNSLQTTDKTVVGAINEHEGDISSLMSGLTNVDVALDVPEGSGKNLIPLSLANYKTGSTTGTWADNVYSVNGIDFTVNTDANGAVTSISASGTASALAMLELTMGAKKGAYTLNGCPSGGSAGYYVQIYKSGFIDVKDRGDGVSVNFASDKNVRVICAIGEGLEVTDLTFYPMLRLASVSDPTFAPYIPSVESRIEAVESGLTNNIFKSRDIISATTSAGAITTYGFIQHMTQVYVIIPVNKPISATSFTVTDIESFFVRYDGHLVDALANITNITGQTVLSNGCLQFAVNFKTGTFSGVEHMPAIITINAKITFV